MESIVGRKTLVDEVVGLKRSKRLRSSSGVGSRTGVWTTKSSSDGELLLLMMAPVNKL